MRKCDVFIFFWKSFFPDYSDLEILKKNGKKIIFCFVGDDVRWFFGQKQEFEYYSLDPLEYENYNYGVSGLKNRLEKIRKSEKLSDMIFSRLDQAQLQLKPYFRFHMMIDNKNCTPNFTQRKDCPRILHAPSNRKIKGSEHVLKALNDLKNEGLRFEQVLIEKMNNKDLLKVIGDSDIIVDQLICPGSGKFATEALAHGKVVISHMAYDSYPQNNNLSYPIIDANSRTLKNVLKRVILDYDLRKKKAVEGREFSESHLDYLHFLKKIDDYLSGIDVPKDYFPTFYRNKFKPESLEHLKCYNDYNYYVKSDKWYIDSVPSGERDGLIF